MPARHPSTVVIRGGGRRARLQEHSQSIPQPLVEIGWRPILWHVTEIYGAQRCRRLVLCLGYKGEVIEQFVGSYDWADGTQITCAARGLDTPVGNRASGSPTGSVAARSPLRMRAAWPTSISRGRAHTTRSTALRDRTDTHEHALLLDDLWAKVTASWKMWEPTVR